MLFTVHSVLLLPPPLPPMPTLTINSKGVMQLHAALRQKLGLRHGQPIDLVAPYGNTPYWYLDLRETAARRVLWHEKSRMRATGIELPPGLVEQALLLELLPGEPAYPNYYPLQPVYAQPTEAPAPPLAASSC